MQACRRGLSHAPPSRTPVPKLDYGNIDPWPETSTTCLPHETMLPYPAQETKLHTRQIASHFCSYFIESRIPLLLRGPSAPSTTA